MENICNFITELVLHFHHSGAGARLTIDNRHLITSSVSFDLPKHSLSAQPSICVLSTLPFVSSTSHLKRISIVAKLNLRNLDDDEPSAANDYEYGGNDRHVPSRSRSEPEMDRESRKQKLC